MKLRTWREGEGLSRREVADKLGTDATSVFRWELGREHADKRIPTSGFMEGIYRLSRGLVTPNDFYDLAPLEQLELSLDAGAGPLFEAAAQEGDGERQLQAAA